jgi:hypothetical protein
LPTPSYTQHHCSLFNSITVQEESYSQFKRGGGVKKAKKKIKQ